MIPDRYFIIRRNEMSDIERTVNEEGGEKEVVSRNFIENEIDKDLAEGNYKSVHT